MLFAPQCLTYPSAKFRLPSKSVFFMAFACAALSFTLPTTAQTVVVDTLPGQGWFHIPQSGIDTTGTVALVNGPDTPPAGSGSLQLTIDLSTDKAAVGNMTAFPLSSRPHLIRDITTVSFSTYVPAGGISSHVPVLKFGGYQQPGSNAFTTLNIDPTRLGTVTMGIWQTWVLNDSSLVSDTNTPSGSPCSQSVPCAFSVYKSTFPDAHFIDIQLAVGSGASTPGSGYVDDVTVGAGTQTFSWNFETPPPAPVPVNTAWLLGLSVLFLGLLATRARRLHFFR